MKKVLFILVLACSTCVHGQVLSEVNEEIDQLLKAPQSPAAVMLGIAESEIARPSDVSDFMASLRQASNGFTSLPVNYSIDFAPYWIWRKNNTDAHKFFSNNVKDNVLQSFTFSIANSNNELISSANTPLLNSALGLGVRFSLLRGNLTEATRNKIKDVSDLMLQKNRKASEVFESIANEGNQRLSDELMALNSQNLSENDKQKKIDSLVKIQSQIQKANAIIAYNQPELDKIISSLVKNIDFKRVGWKLDVNSAVAYHFPDRVYTDRKIDQYGIWLSGGIELDSSLLFLGIVRVQHFSQNNLIGREKNNALDVGLRLLWPINKFSLSGELLYRNNKNILDQGMKYLFNLDYNIGSNYKLNLSFGKDFDGTVSKNGNVISALNFLMGFGNKRKMS